MKLIFGLLALGLGCGIAEGSGAQVLVPRTGTLNSAQPMFCVSPVTGAVEDCGQSAGPGGNSVVVVPTDRGGTITLGGTAQTLAAANAARKGLVVQNPCSATEDLYVSSTGNATTTAGAGDDADLGPCGSWSAGFSGTINQKAVTVNAATTTHAFIAVETQ